MMHLRGAKKRDFNVLAFLVIFAIIACLMSGPSTLAFILFFLGIPSLFLIWRNPQNIQKALLGTLLIGVVFGFAFDFLFELNQVWAWSDDARLMFPYKLFGVVSVDVIISYALGVFFTVLFYEYFTDFDFSKHVSRHYFYALIAGLLVDVVLLGIFYIAPALLIISYAYFYLGIGMMILFLAVVFLHPTVLKRCLRIAPFFALMYVAFECVALSVGLWTFPGQYVGYIQILGNRFPIEELFFWIIASSVVTATFHEFVVDNTRELHRLERWIYRA